MSWGLVFAILFALALAAYLLFEVFLKRLTRTGSAQALLAASYRKAYERAERRRLIRRKRHLARAQLLEELLDAHPDETEVRATLMKLYCAEPNVEPLKKHTLAMLVHNPGDELACSTAFALAREDDFFPQARDIYQNAVKGTPDDVTLLLRYVNFLFGRILHCASEECSELMTEAESLFARILELSPGSTDALWSHAVFLQHKGELEKAAEELSKVSSPQPQLLIQLGEVFRKLGRLEEAELACAMAADGETRSLKGTGPVGNVAYTRLGCIALEKGYEENAAQYLTEAIPSASHASFCKTGLDMELARSLLDRGIAAEAVSNYAEVSLAYKPGDEKAQALKDRADGIFQASASRQESAES